MPSSRHNAVTLTGTPLENTASSLASIDTVRDMCPSLSAPTVSCQRCPDNQTVSDDKIDNSSPWQRGSNENANGLLRDYFPKGTDLSTHSVKHLLAVENELNNRPRLVLNNRAPADLFAALLASQNQPVLRR